MGVEGVGERIAAAERLKLHEQVAARVAVGLVEGNLQERVLLVADDGYLAVEDLREVLGIELAPILVVLLAELRAVAALHGDAGGEDKLAVHVAVVEEADAREVDILHAHIALQEESLHLGVGRSDIERHVPAIGLLILHVEREPALRRLRSYRHLGGLRGHVVGRISIAIEHHAAYDMDLALMGRRPAHGHADRGVLLHAETLLRSEHLARIGIDDLHLVVVHGSRSLVAHDDGAILLHVAVGRGRGLEFAGAQVGGRILAQGDIIDINLRFHRFRDGMEGNEALARLVHLEVLLAREGEARRGVELLRIVDDGGQRVGRSLVAEGYLHLLHQRIHRLRDPVGRGVGVADLISLRSIEGEGRRYQPVVGLEVGGTIVHGAGAGVAGLSLLRGTEGPGLGVAIGIDDGPAVEVYLAVEGRGEGNGLLSSEGNGLGGGREAHALVVLGRDHVAVASMGGHLVLHLAVGRARGYDHVVGQTGDVVAERGGIVVARMGARLGSVPGDGGQRAAGGDTDIEGCARRVLAHIDACFLIYALASLVVGGDAIDVLTLGYLRVGPLLDVVGGRIGMGPDELAVAVDMGAINALKVAQAVVPHRIVPLHLHLERALGVGLDLEAVDIGGSLIGHILIGNGDGKELRVVLDRRGAQFETRGGIDLDEARPTVAGLGDPPEAMGGLVKLHRLGVVADADARARTGTDGLHRAGAAGRIDRALVDAHELRLLHQFVGSDTIYIAVVGRHRVERHVDRRYLGQGVGHGADLVDIGLPVGRDGRLALVVGVVVHTKEALRLGIVGHLVEDEILVGGGYLALRGELARERVDGAEGARHDGVLVDRSLIDDVLVADEGAGLERGRLAYDVAVVFRQGVGARILTLEVDETEGTVFRIVGKIAKEVGLPVGHVIDQRPGGEVVGGCRTAYQHRSHREN